MKIIRVLAVLSVVLMSSCATGQNSIPMSGRKYDVCTTLDGFCWQYLVCSKKFLGKCTKHEVLADKIEVDFGDKIKAKQLFDMDFILQVRDKPL